MKQTFLKLLLLCTFIFSLSACNKDEFETQGEANAKQLQAFVDEHQFSKASIYILKNDSEGSTWWKEEISSKRFEIDGSFVVVDRTGYNNMSHYNLEKLEKFTDERYHVGIYLK